MDWRNKLVNQLADTSIGSLFIYLSQHITVNDELRIEGCDGSLSLTATWFKQHDIEATSGLRWIKNHGPDCNCDCEIYTHLQEQVSGAKTDRQEVQGG